MINKIKQQLIYCITDDVIICNDKELYQKSLHTYLVALPIMPYSKGFCYQTVLVSAINEIDARRFALERSGARFTGDVKMVNY